MWSVKRSRPSTPCSGRWRIAEPNGAPPTHARIASEEGAASLLFVARDQGDQLLACNPGTRAFSDITAARRLLSRERRSQCLKSHRGAAPRWRLPGTDHGERLDRPAQPRCVERVGRQQSGFLRTPGSRPDHAEVETAGRPNSNRNSRWKTVRSGSRSDQSKAPNSSIRNEVARQCVTYARWRRRLSACEAFWISFTWISVLFRISCFGS
jgi:hypothetical protein